MTAIKNHGVQSVTLTTPASKVFDFIANPANLPKWTVAFKEANASKALLVTPNGELPIGLETKTDATTGTIDWYMTMPDGSVGTAFSRVVEAPNNTSIYAFTLMAPPVPLEEVEGTLEIQMGQLAEELKQLQSIFKEV